MNTGAAVKPANGPWRVTIADDNPDDRAEVRRALLKGSSRVIKFGEAETGADAVRAVVGPDGPPDCLVLDYHLPDMTAAEVLAATLGADGHPRCPVVVMTGTAGPEVGRKVIRAGAHDFVGKGWMTPESLARVVDNAAERWAMRRDLAASELRFRTVFAQQYQYALLLTPDGTIREASEQSLRGTDPESVIGLPVWDAVWWRDMLPEGRRVREVVEAARGGKTTQFFTTFHSSLDGVRVADMVVKPMYDRDGRIWGILAEGRDVTAQRAAEEALRQADRRKDEFLATLAHELRNPLAPIRNGLHILRMTPPDSPTAGRAIEVMERQFSHLVHLVDDLLDVSRVSQGKITLRREPVPLDEVVTAAIEAARPLIDDRRHTLDVRVPTPAPVVEGDRTRLVQAVTNFLTNAAKYTDPDGTIQVEVRRTAATATVRVSDSGIGLAAEALGSVWDLFAQVRGTADRSHGGLGIGLSLVKRLAEMHGGSVAVESRGEGHGSTFSITLPALPAPARSAPAASPNPGPRGLRRFPVLVVDDNVDGAETLSMVLKIAGYPVRTAHSGLAALDAVAEFAPRVVFLDIGLPDVTGYEVASRLRADPLAADTVLVALTGWGADDDRRRAAEAGFDHHFTKPVETGRLQAFLAEIDAASPAARES